jgi:hypothetical protein
MIHHLRFEVKVASEERERLAMAELWEKTRMHRLLDFQHLKVVILACPEKGDPATPPPSLHLPGYLRGYRLCCRMYEGVSNRLVRRGFSGPDGKEMLGRSSAINKA